MMNYDPNAGLDMIKDVPPAPPPSAGEDNKKSVPTGLLRFEPENKVDTSQMAEFSSPIEEVMAGPGQMIQDEVMGPSRAPSGQKSSYRSEDQGETKKTKSNNPFGLTDDQFQAAIAGAVAVVAFSKPVQTRLISMVPNFLNESSELTVTGMAVSALVAAIIFFLVKQYMLK
jgi:hypothetical protein